MAIKILGEIAEVIFSSFENPSQESRKVEVNIVRLTGRTTIGAFSIAIPLALLTRYLKPATVTSWTSILFETSLVCGATSSAIFICSLYQCIKEKNKPPYTNRQTLYFERVIEYITVATSTILLITVVVFKKNEKFGRSLLSCYHHFFHPLVICGLTASLIEFFHTRQLEQTKEGL